MRWAVWAFRLREVSLHAHSGHPFTLPQMNTPISAILDRKGSTVFSISPSATIAEAVAEMNRHRVGSVLVLDGGRLVGIFTERDVLRRVVGAGLDPKHSLVSEVMS